MSQAPSKYYKLDVTMKHGFKYSVFCGVKQLAGMKSSAEGYWTESVVVTECTEEDYKKAWWEEPIKPTVVSKKNLPKASEADMQKLEEEAKKPKNRDYPQFSSLETFFGDEPTDKPKRKKK